MDFKTTLFAAAKAAQIIEYQGEPATIFFGDSLILTIDEGLETVHLADQPITVDEFGKAVVMHGYEPPEDDDPGSPGEPVYLYFYMNVPLRQSDLK